MKPFIPKSTAYLRAGQYWSLPLKHGRFGCGVVLSRVERDEKPDTRMFLAGLLEWIGDSQPTEEAIENRPIAARRFAHIKMIHMTGGQLIGELTPWWDVDNLGSFGDDIPTAGYNVFTILAQKQADAK